MLFHHHRHHYHTLLVAETTTKHAVYEYMIGYTIKFPALSYLNPTTCAALCYYKDFL